MSDRTELSGQAAQPLGPVDSTNASQGHCLSSKVTALLEGAGPRRGKL